MREPTPQCRDRGDDGGSLYEPPCPWPRPTRSSLADSPSPLEPRAAVTR